MFYAILKCRERSGSVVECLTRDQSSNSDNVFFSVVEGGGGGGEGEDLKRRFIHPPLQHLMVADGIASRSTVCTGIVDKERTKNHLRISPTSHRFTTTTH